MSSKAPAPANGTGADKSYFEQQRELLLRDIGVSMEQVLQNINKLNRSLEGIVAVGSEFSSVEALWSHFENVMAKDPEAGSGEEGHKREDADATELQRDSSGRR